VAKIVLKDFGRFFFIYISFCNQEWHGGVRSCRKNTIEKRL